MSTFALSNQAAGFRSIEKMMDDIDAFTAEVRRVSAAARAEIDECRDPKIHRDAIMLNLMNIQDSASTARGITSMSRLFQACFDVGASGE